MKYDDRVESEKEYGRFKFKVPNEKERVEAIGLAGESTLFKNMFLHELNRFYHPFHTPQFKSQQNNKGNEVNGSNSNKSKNNIDHWVLYNKEYGETYNEFIRNKKYRSMNENENTIYLVNVLFEDIPLPKVQPSPNETHFYQSQEYNSTFKNTFNNTNNIKPNNSYDRTYVSKSTIIDNNNIDDKKYNNTTRLTQVNYTLNDNNNDNNDNNNNTMTHKKSQTATFTTSLHNNDNNNNNNINKSNVVFLQETQTEFKPSCKFTPSTNTHDEEFLEIAKQFIDAFFFEPKIETEKVTLNIQTLSYMKDQATDTILSVEADSILNTLKHHHKQLIAQNNCYCVIYYTSMPLFHNMNALRNDKYHYYDSPLQDGEEYDKCYGFGSPAEGRTLISFAAFEKVIPKKNEEGEGKQKELTEEQKKRKRERDMKLKAISYKYYIQLLLRSIAVMYGMKTCIYYKCLLNGAINLREFEGHPMEMCPICLRKIYAISVDYSAKGGSGSVNASSGSNNKKRVKKSKCHLYKDDLKVTADPEWLFRRFNMIVNLIKGFDKENNNNNNVKQSRVIDSQNLTMSKNFTSNIYASVRSHVQANAESVIKESDINANNNNKTDEEKDKDEFNKQLTYVFQTEKEWFVQKIKSLKTIHKFKE